MKDEYVNMLDALLVDLRRQLLQETRKRIRHFFFRSIRGCWKSRVGSWFHCFFWVSNGLKTQVYVVDDDDGGDAGGGADIPAGTVYHITWD